MKIPTPRCEIKLISLPVVSSKPASKEFRKALKTISDFYLKNRYKHDAEYLVNEEVQKNLIELSDRLRIFHKLRVRWTAELEQDLKSYHNIEAEPLIREMTAAYLEENKNEKNEKNRNQNSSSQSKGNSKKNRKRLAKRIRR